MTPRYFQKTLLTWFDQYGRKTLPWQQNKTPYRVWVSEIMLQQTQVRTVIPYFTEFMQRFPDVATLAQADEDAVLHCWAGLGYYSRARNLQRAAKMVMQDFAGIFPDSLEKLECLPGIGLSTAGAILAIAYNQPATILDGNVKRVLARLHGIIEPINEKRVEEKLWVLAKQYTPTDRVADYTQAIMDLGATFCTRSKPQCSECPFHKKCGAYQQDLVEQIPSKKAARKLPVRQATFVILKKGAQILLQKRPPAGIWGGLWSLPEITGHADKKTVRAFCQATFQAKIDEHKVLNPFRHTFSHYHLDIFPVIAMVKSMPVKIMAIDKQIWYNPNKPDSVGLPKPVQMIIRMMT